MADDELTIRLGAEAADAIRTSEKAASDMVRIFKKVGDEAKKTQADVEAATQKSFAAATTHARNWGKYAANMFSSLGGLVKGFGDLLTHAMTGAGIAIGAIFGPAGMIVGAFVGGILSVIPRLFLRLYGTILQIFGQLVGAIVNIFSSIVSAAWKILKGIIEAAWSVVKGVVNAFASLVGVAAGIFGRIAKTALKAFGIIVAAAGTTFALAIRQAVKFEKGMMEAFSLIGQRSRDVIEGVMRDINLMTTRIPVSAAVASRAYYNILSAGITKASDAYMVLDVAARAAVAGQADIEQATTAIIRILSAYYNTAAPKAAEASDFLFSIIEKGIIRLEDLAWGIGVIAGPAASAGVSLEDLAGALSLVTRFLPPEIAMRGLRRMMIQLVAPSRSAKMAMESFGLEMEDVQGNFIGLRAAVEQFAEKGIVSLKQIEAVIGDVRGAAAMSALLKQLDKFDWAFSKTADVIGKTDRMFQQMLSSAAMQFKLLWNNVKAFTMTFGMAFLNILTPALTQVNTLLQKANLSFNRWMEDVGKEQIKKWAQEAYQFIADLVVIIDYEATHGWPMLTAAINDAWDAIKAGPAVIWELVPSWQSVKDAAGDALDWMEQKLRGVFAYLEESRPAINAWIAYIVKGIRGIVPVIVTILNVILTVVQKTLNALIKMTGWAIEMALTRATHEPARKMREEFRKASEEQKEAWLALERSMRTDQESLTRGLKLVVEKPEYVGGRLGEAAREWALAKQELEAFKEIRAKGLVIPKVRIPQLPPGVTKFLDQLEKGIPEGAFTNMADAASSAADSVRKFGEDAETARKRVFKDVGAAVGRVPGAIAGIPGAIADEAEIRRAKMQRDRERAASIERARKWRESMQYTGFTSPVEREAARGGAAQSIQSIHDALARAEQGGTLTEQMLDELTKSAQQIDVQGRGQLAIITRLLDTIESMRARLRKTEAATAEISARVSVLSSQEKQDAAFASRAAAYLGLATITAF